MSIRPKQLRRLALGLAILLALGVVVIAAADLWCRSRVSGRIYHSPAAIPTNEVGLVLGTSRLTRSGRPNLHFQQRIDAAVELFNAGKVRQLLVSGDNSVKYYDEPTAMRAALIAAGVPTNAISCDYAGLRTLDSVLRAQLVFGLTNFTVITEAFHCPRAVWIARRHGLDVVGYAAPDLSAEWSARVKVRELLARTWCAVDLYVLNRQPKHVGPRESLANVGKQ